MKILTIVFLAIPFIGLSQTYQPFPTDNAVWKEYRFHYWAGGGGNKNVEDNKLIYSMNGDTAINSNIYRKIYYTAIIVNICCDPPYSSTTTYHRNEYVGSIREDSLKRIYILPPNETSEMLLYDFNLSIGDTIISNFIDSVKYPGTYFTVGAIDSVLVKNNFHKRYHIIPPSGSYTNSINQFNKIELIEGIGSSLGLFQFRYNPNHNNNHELECFKQSDISAYPSGDSCYVNLNVGIQDISFPELKLFPNPTSNTLQLELGKYCSKLVIHIYNFEGKLVSSVKKENTNKAVFGLNLVKGIYLVEIYMDGQRSIHKIIKN